MTTPTVDLAIIGCGGMGRRHVHGLAELHRALESTDHAIPIRLAVVIDRDTSRAEALADEAASMLGKVPLVRNDLESVAREGSANAVDICTATESHHTLGVLAANLGLDLFIEKPLAATIRGATAIIDAARKAGRTLGVAENIRREPVNRFVRALIHSGAIGDIRFVLDLSFSGGDAILLTPWRHRRLTGGTLLDVAVHNGDVIEYLAGPVETITGMVRLDEPVRHRRARMPVASASFYEGWQAELPETVEVDAPDVGIALLSFASGAAGQWTLHQAAHGQKRSLRMIYGSTGSIESPPDRSGQAPILVTSTGERVTNNDLLALLPEYSLPPVEAAIWGSATCSHIAGSFAEIDRRLVAVELHDFAQAVMTRTSPEVNGEDGRRNMALYYAIAESAAAGKPVAIQAVAQGNHHASQDGVDAELGLLYRKS